MNFGFPGELVDILFIFIVNSSLSLRKVSLNQYFQHDKININFDQYLLVFFFQVIQLRT